VKGIPVEPLQPTDPTTIGRYRVTGRLGAGGMGSVFVGLSPGGRPAAVKVIHESFQGDAEALARFRREVETLRTVRSAYTAALIDSQTEVAPYWLATEYVPGPTLHAAVENTGPFAADACYGMLAALAEGLADIHSHGICHRDLKPRNVILAATGPQLIDFGIARGDGQEGITRAGYAVGTPGYTAPEMLAGDPVTPAADVFALGATIAFAATGRPPYGGGTVTTVSLRAMNGQVDLVGIDPGLAQLLRACAAVDPAQRPAPKAIIEACDRRTTSPVTPRTPAGAGAGHTSVLPAELTAGHPSPGTGPLPWQPGAGTPTTRHFGAGLASVPGPRPDDHGVGREFRGGHQPVQPHPLLSRNSKALVGGMAALIVILLAVVLTQLSAADDHDVPLVAAPAATSTEAEAEPTTDSAPDRQQTKADDSSEPKQTAGDPGTGNRGVPGGDQAAGENWRTGEIKVDIADGTFYCVRMPANPQLLSNLELTECSGNADQQWTRTSWEGFQQGDLCMDMGPDNDKPGENRTRVFPCNETDTQTFYWEKSGRLSNPNGLCLGVGDSEEGFVLTMVECGNDILRPWKIPG
jgi:hypothetical protein